MQRIHGYIYRLIKMHASIILLSLWKYVGTAYRKICQYILEAGIVGGLFYENEYLLFQIFTKTADHKLFFLWHVSRSKILWRENKREVHASVKWISDQALQNEFLELDINNGRLTTSIQPKLILKEIMKNNYTYMCMSISIKSYL